MKQKLILSLLFTSLLIFPVSGDVTSDVGAGMVAAGIDMFFDSTSKSIGGNSSSFQTLSVMYNPFDNPAVRSTIKGTSIFAFTIFVAYVLLAMCYLVMQSRAPEKARAIEFALNSGKSFNLEKFAKNCATIMGLFIFVVIIIVFLLNLAQAASNMMDTSALTAIENSAQSGVIKLMYSILWVMIEILLAMRSLIITIICAFVVILIFLWKFPRATKAVEIIGLYLVLLIFMQPVMVGAAAVGIETINYLSSTTLGYGAGHIGTLTLSLALLIILVVIAAIFIIGPFYFHESFFSLRS